MNFFILILILLFTSCDFKPRAEGVENQIHVVVSFEDFSKVKTIIDSIFLPEILTPEPESFFELKYILPEDFDKIKNYHNILIVSILDIPDSTGDKLIYSFLPKNSSERNENKIFSKRDVFARDQVFSVVYGKDFEDFKNTLIINSKWIYNKYFNFYRDRQEKHLFKRREQNDLSNLIFEKFNWKIRIQHDFTLIKEDSNNNFIWLGRAFPFRWLSFNWNDYNNKLTFENLNFDTLLNEYSKFYNNDILFLKKYRNISRDKIGNFDAIKLEGLWEHNSDVKGGPFISYFFYDTNLKKLFHINLLVYNPGRKKLPSLLQLEIMSKTYSSKLK